MTNSGPLAAEMLESSASGYAAAALAALEARRPVRTADSGRDLAADRRAYFVQRVLELAAALRAAEPALFTARITWLRKALRARGADESELAGSLEALRQALEHELPETLRAAAIAPVEAAIADLGSPARPDTSILDPASETGRIAIAYLEACLAGDQERALASVVAAVEGGLDVARAYTEVLAPAEQEIGRLWHVGDVTVAEERIVSETTHRLMAVLSYRFSAEVTVDRTILAAAVPGNTHDIGLAIVADLFRLAGWRSLFLGASVPAEQIGRAAHMFAADLVALAVTLSTQLNDARKAVEATKRGRPGVRVLVGGAAFEAAPGLWRQLEADGYAATVDRAVAVGKSLVEGR
jgi:methanogenic corrinoid protein MtbC1